MVRKTNRTNRTFWFASALVVSAAVSLGCRGTAGGRSSDGHNHSHGSLSLGERSFGSPVSTESYESSTQGRSGVSASASTAQRTCPVTGEELGSMGDPIPVSVKGRTIFVCCQGCVNKVRRNPDKYIASVDAESRG